jgi:energy-converting hydrogenase Eha subunit B
MPDRLSNAIIGGTVSSYNYVNGGVVYTSIGGGNVAGTLTLASMSIFNIPSPASGTFAYTTTFIINQTQNNKGYIKTIGINNNYTKVPEFIGGLPTINASTSTIIQTVTAIITASADITKVFTNATVCSGTV